MKLLVDDREDKERINKLEKMYDVEVRRLEFGDIIIVDEESREQGKEPKDIAIEVKTIQDFIASSKNQRLIQESINMKKKYPYSYVIVYDDGKLNPKYSYQTSSQKCGSIVKVVNHCNTPLFWGLNFNDFVHYIDSLAMSVKKMDEPLDPPIVRPKDSNEMVNVLIGINSVGKKMANKLLDKFRTPGGVFRATDEELDTIPRLSSKAKSSIRRMR